MEHILSLSLIAVGIFLIIFCSVIAAINIGRNKGNVDKIIEDLTDGDLARNVKDDLAEQERNAKMLDRLITKIQLTGRRKQKKDQ